MAQGGTYSVVNLALKGAQKFTTNLATCIVIFDQQNIGLFDPAWVDKSILFPAFTKRTLYLLLLSDWVWGNNFLWLNRV